jgi:hypothetical protein
MRDGKSFIARPESHKALVLGYLTFPEITEVFLNIARDVPLSKRVLSGWDKETLEGHISQFMAPLLVEAGAISKDSSRKCGYKTDYTELAFEGLTRSQLAQVASRRAVLIGESIEDTDTRDEVLSANVNFHALPDNLRVELIGSLRAVLVKYLDNIPDTAAQGRQFRLALVARAEK